MGGGGELGTGSHSGQVRAMERPLADKASLLSLYWEPGGWCGPLVGPRHHLFLEINANGPHLDPLQDGK